MSLAFSYGYSSLHAHLGSLWSTIQLWKNMSYPVLRLQFSKIFVKTLRLNHRNIKFMKLAPSYSFKRTRTHWNQTCLHSSLSMINLELPTAVVFSFLSWTENWRTLILETWGKISVLRRRVIASLSIFVLLWEINMQGALVVMFVWSLISRFNIWSTESNLILNSYLP